MNVLDIGAANSLITVGGRLGGKKLSFTTRYVLLVGILLLIANTALGIVVLNESKASMRALINKDMLDIVNSAAGSIDGDELGALTEDDVDGPVFNKIKRQLLVFQNSVDIQFIYAVKQADEDHYVFTVDPDPVDPGEFGEEVLTTPALVEAAGGAPTVDSDPAADRWGNFYSAYSPVFDSDGAVVGVIGVDFDTDWYESQIQRYTFSIAVVTALSVLLAAIMVVVVTHSVRIKFRNLDDGLSDLSEDVDILMGEMASYSGFEIPETMSVPEQTVDTDDELEVLSDKIRAMHSEMRLYLDYLHTQAYTDALTKVANSSAYHEAVHDLNKRIAEGTADFWVAVFDINGLKELNDTYSHECGDYYIQGAAKALTQALGSAPVYRIGGDEFAAVIEGTDQAGIDQILHDIDVAVEAFNAMTRYPAELALSIGVAHLTLGEDASFKDVFARADQAMYNDKRAYYQAQSHHGRRRSDHEYEARNGSGESGVPKDAHTD